MIQEASMKAYWQLLKLIRAEREKEGSGETAAGELVYEGPSCPGVRVSGTWKQRDNQLY